MSHDIIFRMESMQSRFRRLQIEDREDNRTDEQKAIGAYYDRVMSERGHNGELDYLADDEHTVEGSLANFDRYIAGDR